MNKMSNVKKSNNKTTDEVWKQECLPVLYRTAYDSVSPNLA